MALKQVVDTTKNTYLTKRFEDDEGNQYGDVISKSLVAWYRFDGTTNKSTATITYTGQPADGNTLTLISTDGTSKTYEFDNNDSLAAAGRIAVAISGDDADATYAALKTAITGGTGHDGKIAVTHTDDNNNAGTITFTQSVGGSEGNTLITATIANTSALPAGFATTAGSPSNLSTNKFYDDENPPVLIDVSASYGLGAAPGPTLSTEKIGDVIYNVASFDGSNDHITIGTSTAWDHIIGNESSSTKKMSFSVWAKKTNDGQPGNIIDFGFSDVNISVAADYAIQFLVRLNTGPVVYKTGALPTTSTFRHIVCTYDANDTVNNFPKIYVDGKLQTVSKSSGTTSGSTFAGIDSSNLARIGDLAGSPGASGGGSWNGKLSEVCVWNHVLTHENVKAIYNTSKSRFTRNQTISGFLNHSPRIQSIENINYHDVHDKFDDTRTIDFIDPRQTAVIKVKKRPYDARVLSITDPHSAPGDSASATSKTFEFQLGVILGSGNIEINLKDAKTPAQVARKIVSAINSNTVSGAWSFTATQTKPNEVTIVRNKIDESSACTLSTNAGERFIEIVKNFSKKPQPITVYPNMEMKKSSHLLERKNYGSSISSDIQIVRPVSRITPVRPKKVITSDPFNESLAHASFGFEEGIASVSPEKALDSDFYVSGSTAIGPEGIKNRKKIVLDMPVTQDTDLQLVTNASPRTNRSSNFPMAYYNFTSKSWQRIGLGSGSFSESPSGTSAERQAQFNRALDFTMVGFTPSRGLKAWRVADRSTGTPNEAVGFERYGVFEFAPAGALAFRNGSTQHPKVLNVGSLASPTNVFGFPAHPKFHAADSQQLLMSKHITKPFVLEKIVYEFNVGMKGSYSMSTLSSDVDADSSTVDFDTVTFFILNQREAAVGKELSEVPTFRIADSDGSTPRAKLKEAISYTNPICPTGKEIPRKIQLTPHNVSGSAASVAETEVSTIRDLVTWSRLTSSPSGFNSVYLDAYAKDVRKDSDLVLTPDDNMYPFGTSRKITYEAQPAVGSSIRLVSADGTDKLYVFVHSTQSNSYADDPDASPGHDLVNYDILAQGDTLGTGVVLGANDYRIGGIAVVILNDADATYDTLATIVRHSSGHGGRILVSHTDNDNNAGEIIFHMGPKKYSISAECISPVVQITSGSVDVGSAALGEISSTAAYFGISSTGNTIEAVSQTGQTIALSKRSIGRTLVGLQSGRSLVGENPSSSRMYTFRGLKIGDAKITAYEKDFGKSPYIILPTDKLVIGCQSPISTVLDGAHPHIRLGKGDGRIILYGYELEKEHPSYKEFSKDSTGNSSFLSENIGDIAVRDEFDTHPRMTYYRSSIDEVVTGSMLPDTVGPDFNTQTQEFARKVVGRNSQGTQGEAGSLLRARKLQDRSERYYDSMTPDIRDLMAADSVNTLDITGLRTSGIILGVAGTDSAYKSYVATGVDAATKVIWDNWFSSFPFEARYSNAARLRGVRKDIPTKVQTGANKSIAQKTSVDHVSLALFENTGTLGVTGMVNGVYSTDAILDNPTESENTNRLIPRGRSSRMFTNFPPINLAEVYATWTAQDVAATGSIQFDTSINTLAEIKSLNMKTLSVPFLGTGQTATVSEDFVFAHLDEQTNEHFYPGTAGTHHKLGEVKVSVSSPPVLTISYDDGVQVSDFADMLIQVPTTGSAPDTSALKLFLDSAGTDPTGNKSTASTLDNNTHVNKGSLTAMGTSDTILNDMWTTGSVVQLSKTASSTNIVDKSGTTITSGGVSINTPILLFNDRAGNEAQRFIDLDRLVNSYDKDDRTQTGVASLTAIPVDNEMSLTFKHARGVNTNVHATLNEPPDGNEDIQVQLSYGVAATANIYVEGRTENASTGKTPEKGAVTITSTDGTVRKYIIVDTIAGGSGGATATTGTRLISTTDTGTGQAGTDNVGAIAVAINITGSSTLSTRSDYLTQLKAAIESSAGHNGKIVVGSVTNDGDNAYITLTQSKAGPSGNTTIVKSVEAINIATTSTAFSGGSTRNPTDNAVWGNKIDHSTDSRVEGFISNDFRLGHSVKINVNGFGRTSAQRPDSFVDSGGATGTRYADTNFDYIKFKINCTESGQIVERQYQFYPADSSSGLTANVTSTAATGNTSMTGATFTYAFNSGVANNTNDSTAIASDLARARKLSEAINAASRFENQSGHEKGRFCALVSQEGSDTFINIYFTSFGIGQSAVATPDLAEIKYQTNAGGNVNNTTVACGGGGADDVFVSINQTAASFTDSYAFADIQLSADLDPAEEFLTYTTYEASGGGSPKKDNVVAVNISGATNVDEVYAEIANAINITTTTNTDAIKPFDGMITAAHDIAANTLALTYNVPVKSDNYKHVLNKVLLPLPGARYTFTGLRPDSAQHTHRLIPISDTTPVSTAYQPLTTRLNTVFANTTAAVAIDGTTWAPVHAITNASGDNNNIGLEQQGKGIAGNGVIASTADTSLLSTLGFGGGESSIYGDGDNIPEPLDADPNSYSSLEITCDASNVADLQTLSFTIGNKAYSSTINQSITAANSTNSNVGISDVIGRASTILTYSTNPSDGQTIVLTATNNVSRTYQFKNSGPADGTNVLVLIDPSFPPGDVGSLFTYDNFVTAVLSSDGHNGAITAVNDDTNKKVTLTQRDAGAAGNTSITEGLSNATLSPVNFEGGVNANSAQLAVALKKSLEISFASEIQSQKIKVETKSGSTNVIVISAKNSFHIQAATPIPTGTGIDNSTFSVTGWSGADLVKIKGSLLKRKSVQKGVFENDPEDIDTVHFASIIAKDVPAQVKSDSLEQVFELGSFIKSTESDYFSKVFFGTGDGPSKSPRHKITEKSNLIKKVGNTQYEVVKHDGAAACSVNTSNFTLTGVAPREITNAGSGHNFVKTSGPDTADNLLGFTGAGTRRMDLDVEIQAGETVEIRYAAASFWNATSNNPHVVSAEGVPAEKADNGDAGVHVRVSVDGGVSYGDVHTVFGAQLNGSSVSSSSLFAGSGAQPIVKSSNFDDGADVSLAHHTEVGSDNTLARVSAPPSTTYYPVFKFTATSSCKLRLEQPYWSSQSVSYDHWWFRFLLINVAPPPGDGSGAVAVSGRGNFNQSASATGIELRGAKYGLVSPVRLNTSAIFRAGSFGQVRDMLEQRPLTRTFDGQRVSEPPVAVSFQERQSKRPISPEETNSANLDIFCTSSLPYFDGLTKDRTSSQPDLVDEIDIDISV